MLDRWAFGMSKIEGNGGPASSTERTASADADEAARAIGKVSLDAGVPTDELAALLRRGQHEEAFAVFDPDIAAAMVRTVIDGASFHLTERAIDDVDRQIAEVVTLLERAIGSETS